MDCLQAQEAISAALDRQPVEATLLAEAKDHCRNCADCGAFVRAQLAVKQVPLPAPHSDLADRVMVAVRAESARASADAGAAPDGSPATGPIGGQSSAPDATTQLPEVFAPPEPLATLRAPERRAPRLGRRATAVALGSMAAVMFVGAIIAGVIGTRQVSPGPAVRSTVFTPTPQSAPTAGGAAPESGATGARPETADVASATAVQYTAFNNLAYRSTGPSTISQGVLHIVGVATTALSGTGAPVQRTIFAGADTSDIYIADDSNTLLDFRLVTRQYQGRTYQLLAGRDISAFGVWPALPPRISPPTATDGSPTLVQDGTDAAGTTIYRLSSPSAPNEIAVGPGTGATDPAAGNPNWTLWTTGQ